MTETAADTRVLERRIGHLEAEARRAAGLHALFPGTLLLIGVFLPFGEVLLDDDLLVQFNSFGLPLSAAAYDYDHPTLLVLSSAAALCASLATAAAFVVAAIRQSARAAKVALVGSALLLPIVFGANASLGYLDVVQGSGEAALSGWSAGGLVLLVGAVIGCWVSTTLLALLER